MTEKEKPTIGRQSLTNPSPDALGNIVVQRYSKCGDCTNNSSQNQNFSTDKNAIRVRHTTLSEEKQASQMQRVYDCFAERPRTMLDVSIATGILQANICRYVAKWRKAGMIQVHHLAKDVHTRMMCAYLTTDTALFNQPMFNQLNLFD